jgi:hypothetical protein
MRDLILIRLGDYCLHYYIRNAGCRYTLSFLAYRGDTHAAKYRPRKLNNRPRKLNYCCLIKNSLLFFIWLLKSTVIKRVAFDPVNWFNLID